jgi:hypothetical protein
MIRQERISGDQLADALAGLGVKFLIGGRGRGDPLEKHPAHLIAALAESEEARLRLALIPLFLEHPEFSTHLGAVSAGSTVPARLTLQCYYTAAVWLQQRYTDGHGLVDLFSRQLGVEVTDDPGQNLEHLARRQRELSGMPINWLGTYEHAAEIWLKAKQMREA